MIMVPFFLINVYSKLLARIRVGGLIFGTDERGYQPGNFGSGIGFGIYIVVFLREKVKDRNIKRVRNSSKVSLKVSNFFTQANSL